MVVLGGQGDGKLVLEVAAEVADSVLRDGAHCLDLLLVEEALQVVVVVGDSFGRPALADFEVFEEINMEGLEIKAHN